VFGKRKNREKKPERSETRPPVEEEMSAYEKAYLENLQKMMSTPGESPYLGRKKQKRSEPGEEDAQEPVFDSGPMTANQAKVAASKGNADNHGQAPSLETDDGRIRRGGDGVYQMEIDVPSADLGVDEETEQPKSPPPKKKPARAKPPEATVEPEAEPAPSPPSEAPPESEALFPRGTLVVWNGNQLGIYVEHQTQKGYDVVYVVEADGRLQPKGVCLFAYEPKRVGMLSEPIYKWMERSMRWERDALLCHFEDPALGERIPALKNAPPAESSAAESAPGNNGEEPVVGQTFTLSMGPNEWHGVYWGHDRMGTVVAHNTNRVWSLMHLDLQRFGASVRFGDVLPDEQIKEIETAVNGK
jgi:hypothetical protein